MPLFWLSLAWIVGILAGSLLGGPAKAGGPGELGDPAPLGITWQGWLALGLACLALTALLRRTAPSLALARRLAASGGRLVLPPLVLLAVCLAGAARYQAAHPALTPTDIAWYSGRGPLRITGVIVAPPETRDTSTRLRVEARSIAPFDATSPIQSAQPVRGLVLVEALPGRVWAYGDLVELAGEPAALPAVGQSPYQDYLARQGIQAVVSYPTLTRLQQGQGSPFWAALYAIKARGLSVLESIFPAPESDLLGGILLGEDGGIPAPLQAAFRRTGTSHIIAISG
jgi:competence protein ComEC